ncbi:hypothetical protein JKF63_05776 [Porcisia hertigi]|uniref:Uncharacterized protein n=1 Tax=Porcisia hertigi TaxID=2761500 RepID=A0A836IL74_9TRYP|nr:hypothetical protein JKF63_05776 [Porcisia hertigi]
MLKTAHVVGAALALITCLVATAVSAQQSLECQTVWDGPSASNDLLQCLSNSDRLRSQWRYFLYPGFAALIFLFTLIVLPLMFCWQCCTCARGCGRKPKTVQERDVSRCFLWMWISITVIITCGVCVLLVLGAILLEKSVSNIFDDAEFGTLRYFNETRSNITELLTNHTADPPIPPPIDLSAFDVVNTEVTNTLQSARKDFVKYAHIAKIVVFCVGSVGIFLMLCIVVFAGCRCGGCCPVLWSCIYFVFALAFSLFAVLFTLIIYAMFAACGEVNLQYKRAPGIFQWYLVPLCEKQFDFQSLRAEVAEQERESSQEACRQVLQYCDNDIEYPGSNMEHIFMCGKGITDKTQCNSLADVVDVVSATYAKPILTNTMCVNQTGMKYLEKCTLSACSSRCVDYEFPNLPAKRLTTLVVDASGFAANASTALSYVHPLLSCNFIIDKISSTIEMPKYSDSYMVQSKEVHSCSAVRTASVILGTGFFVGALMFIVGICVMHRGANVWLKLNDSPEPIAPSRKGS